MRRIVAFERLVEIAGFFLFLVLPLLIYLKHQDYSLLAPEVLSIYGLILVFSVVFRLAVLPGKTPAYVITLTVLSVLAVDIQTELITTVGLRLLLFTTFFGALFWFMRRQLPRFIVAVAGGIVLATVLLPSAHQASSIGEPAARDDDPDLPFVLHLILDAQIGVEGIPMQFDPDRKFADQFRDFYLDNSFRVYGRAYSRYCHTRISIPNLMNFTASAEPNPFWKGKYQVGMLMQSNLWFDYLHDLGYRLHILESDLIRYFDTDETGTNPYGDSVQRYDIMTIKPIEKAPLPFLQKVPFILSTYLNLSWILQPVAAGYTDLAFSDLGRTLRLPQWDLLGGYLGSLSAFQALDVFTEQLGQAGPGQAYFAYLLLPHSPFGLDQDCGMDWRPSRWSMSMIDDVRPRYNTHDTREQRYYRYLDQATCLQSRLESIFQILQEKGLWEDAIVIVHGDHGSRIAHMLPRVSTLDDVVPTDFLDAFSTHFAVKAPGIEPGYDRQMFPIDYLFKRTVRDGEIPDDSELDANPFVYLHNSGKDLVKHPLPEFSHGRPRNESSASGAGTDSDEATAPRVISNGETSGN